MALADVADLLRCPVCTGPLTPVGRSVRCPDRHSFDLARQGYLNLLRGAVPRHADTAPMVAARERFLGAGHYDPLARALRDTVAAYGPPRTADAVVLDVGAGPGYYLAMLLAESGPTAGSGRGLALDVSVAACRRAAGAHPRVGAVVADVWAGLPVRDRCADVLLDVFAPRQPAEFARVLRPDGCLVVVAPTAAHLVELRRPLGLLEVGPDKQDRVAATLSDAFRLVGRTECRFGLRLDAATVLDLVGMGPNAFHADPAELAARVDRVAAEPLAVTASVVVTAWRSR